MWSWCTEEDPSPPHPQTRRQHSVAGILPSNPRGERKRQGLTYSREWNKPLDQEPSGRRKLVCSLNQHVKAHLEEKGSRETSKAFSSSKRQKAFRPAPLFSLLVIHPGYNGSLGRSNRKA